MDDHTGQIAMFFQNTGASALMTAVLLQYSSHSRLLYCRKWSPTGRCHHMKAFMPWVEVQGVQKHHHSTDTHPWTTGTVELIWFGIKGQVNYSVASKYNFCQCNIIQKVIFVEDLAWPNFNKCIVGYVL